MDSIAIVFHRVVIAFVSLGIMMVILKRSFKVPSKIRLIQIAFTGIIVGLHWLTFFHAIQLSTASFGVLCLSTTTLHVSWLEPIIMKRPFSWMEFLLSVIVVFGIYFVSGDLEGNHLLALIYGLSSALFAASFSVFNAYFAQDTAPSTITFYEMLVAAVAIGIMLLSMGRFNAELFTMSWSDLGWLLFLGVLCTSFAFLATIEIVKHIGAFTASLSINLEPVYAIILGILILNENEELNADFYVGAAIIVGVVFLNGFIKSYYKKKSVTNKP